MVNSNSDSATKVLSPEDIIECLTQTTQIKNYLCVPEDPTDDTCRPEWEACGPDYGVNCMPDCDPADDW